MYFKKKQPFKQLKPTWFQVKKNKKSIPTRCLKMYAQNYLKLQNYDKT